MSEYLSGKIYNLFLKKSTYEVNKCEKSEVVYNDHIEYFGNKIDQLLLATNKVKKQFYFNLKCILFFFEQIYFEQRTDLNILIEELLEKIDEKNSVNDGLFNIEVKPAINDIDMNE